MLKVTLNEQPKEEKKFPKLMKDYDGEVFFMVRENYGLPLTGVFWGYKEENFADFSKADRQFTDYNEPVTLQNA